MRVSAGSGDAPELNPSFRHLVSEARHLGTHVIVRHNLTVIGSSLVLNLVYNPVGAFLPPPQASIEADFKRELLAGYGVSFNHLYTITNMPIKRFLDYLRRSGNEERYIGEGYESENSNKSADSGFS